MAILSLKSRPLRAYLDVGVGGVLAATLITAVGMHFTILNLASQESELQLRALSRNRAQTELMQSLAGEELSIRSFLVTGDRAFLRSHEEQMKAGASSLQSFQDNLVRRDAEDARWLVERLQQRIYDWRKDVIAPLLKRRLAKSGNPSERELQEERARFEEIRNASESLLRFLDARDEFRLGQVARQRLQVRWISISVLGGLVLLAFVLTRWLVRRIATPLTALADAAGYGRGFPVPETVVVREIDILGQALWDLDGRVKDRESALLQEREEARSVQAFMELVQLLATEEDILDALELALQRLVKPDRMMLLLRPAQGDGLVVRGGAPWDPDQEPPRVLREAMACRALRQSNPVELNAHSPTACLCPLGVPEQGSYLCLPLAASGQLIGLVNLQSAQPRYWQGSRRSLATTCVAVVASALQAVRALAQAKEQAVRDPLTGAFNRRFLGEMLDKLVAQGQRQERPLSALMLDLDHFKRINDSFGHDVGDKVLVAFARHLKQNVRTGDLLARYGGEEFVIVLPDTDNAVAHALAERMRRGIEALRPEDIGVPSDCRVTCSIGVATLPEHGLAADSLLNAADKALYCAKGSGRNQVVSATAISLP